MPAINRFGFGPRAVACAFALAALSPSAGAVTLDELKGYSITIDATLDLVWKQSQARNDPMANVSHYVRKFYVGLTGRIFDYADQSAGSSSEHQGVAVAPNAAASNTRQQMMASTIEGGNFVSITHQVEGFTVITISVDVARMTCDFTIQQRPDPTTGRVVIFKLNGYKDELASMQVRSPNCAIRHGNIFSTDQ